MTVIHADNIRGLALAIVQQACADYREHRKIVKEADEYIAENPWSNWSLKRYAALSQMHDIEKFIRSPWFEILTDLDPETLIRKLKEVEI